MLTYTFIRERYISSSEKNCRIIVLIYNYNFGSSGFVKSIQQKLSMCFTWHCQKDIDKHKHKPDLGLWYKYILAHKILFCWFYEQIKKQIISQCISSIDIQDLNGWEVSEVERVNTAIRLQGCFIPLQGLIHMVSPSFYL